ncbi:phage tail protein [Clostridium sp. ZBS2]|uniref:phage tail protein n=1 Tax=Clostridium sp. ZBS2 TaxID=2949976 RepID=UPI0020792BCA|nr:phage tail protein [Clostridium sp. ZBS2]
MKEKFYTILTNIGKAKIANSSALGSKVNFAKIKAGDGNGKYYEPTEDQIKLVNTVWEGNIRNIEVTKENPNWIEIEAIIPSDEGGFTIREFGVFDEDDNLLAISKCPETYKPIICDGSIKELLIKMVLSVSNTDNVSLKIDPTIVVAKKSDVEKVSANVDEIKSQMKDIANDSYPIVEATGTNAYVGSTARITKLSKGTRCTLFIATDSNNNCNLNLNNYGAKNIKDSFGNIVTNLKANIPYNLCYNGLDFILQGKGGGGNATSSQVLLNSTFTNDSGPQIGSMPNRGAPVVNLNCGGTFNLQEGYYSGGQAIANSLASQTPGNATASQILAGFSAWVNGNKVAGSATLESLGVKKFKSGTGKVLGLQSVVYKEVNLETNTILYSKNSYEISLDLDFIAKFLVIHSRNSVSVKFNDICITLHDESVNSNDSLSCYRVNENINTIPTSFKEGAFTYYAFGN